MEITNRTKLRVAVDGHVLLQKQKTGVGRTAEALIDELCKDPDVEVTINFVDALGYRCKEIIRKYRKLGCRTKLCWWMPYSLYHKWFEKLKIPYSLLFGKKNDYTLFFEYYVPYSVGTKVANYVYDVNYKVYPETVEKDNLQWLESKLPLYCDRSDLIITISEFSKQEIMKYLHIEDEKIKVVPCGINLKCFSRELAAAAVRNVKEKFQIQDQYILYLGTLEPRKNLPLLIEAYDELVQDKDVSNVPQLVIAGKRGWMYDQLFDMVDKRKLQSRVIFTGYVDDDEAYVLMKSAEIFVFPSVYEGFGMPPLEAMACGTPVIVSDAASLPEVVGDGAKTFESGNMLSLYRILKLLVLSADIKQSLSERGIKRAQMFSWQRAEKLLLECL